MESRNLRLLVAGIGVVVVATLALTVSLWPDQKKDSARKPGNTGDENALATAKGSGAKMATAAKPNASPNGGAKNNSQALPTTKDVKGSFVTPPVTEQIGTALVFDEATGKMKEVPYTAKVMMLRNADGTPMLTQGIASIMNVDGTQRDPSTIKVKELGGPTSRPTRLDKKN